MAYIVGTSSNYQTYADMIRRIAIGTSASTATLVGGGTGYAVGDKLNVNDGAGVSIIKAQVEVLAVSGGVITQARIFNAGLYTSTPANNVGTTASTGTGSGATFSFTWATNGWNSKRAVGCPNAVQSATVQSGGIGYTVGNTLTATSGSATPGNAATFQVTAVSGGVVTAVSVIKQGDYTTSPSNPVTTSGPGTGCTLNLTFGTGQREFILEGTGSGSDSILCGYITYNDPGSSACNIQVNGFTGYSSGLSYNSQPGRSPGLYTDTSGPEQGGCFVPLLNSTFNWFVSITSRRIIAVANVGSCNASLHMGFINAFATSSEWPYPLLVAGSTTDRIRLPGTTNISTSSCVDPIKDSQYHVGPCIIRDPSGQWRDVANSYMSGTSSRYTIDQGAVMAPGGLLIGVSRVTEDDWFTLNSYIEGTFRSFIPEEGSPGYQTFRLLPTKNSTGDIYQRFPATVVWSATGPSSAIPGGVYGEIDGVSWFDGAGTVNTGSRLADGSNRHQVFSSGARSDSFALWALKES